MRKTLAIVLFLLCSTVSFAQESVGSSSTPMRSSKSYMIVEDTEQDLAFLKEKSRQAGLDLGLSVLANRISTDSKLVTPKPSDHLLKQGILHLQLPMDDNQTEFAVYHSELFDIPATINVLQIEDELITYRTTERTGNINLLYHCTRGAFGTKAKAHSKDAIVYKLWDTPERTLLPDLEIQDQMAQKVAKTLSKTDYPLLVFNDLKSYAYNTQGDTAIAHFLDTIRKYNPDKLLQADLLTPASWYRLSRINENQLWNESMRNKVMETLPDKQLFHHICMFPWMIGNFQIILADKNRKATTLEELEWFLSIAAAFDGGFGLNVSAETLRRHGLTDKMMNAIRIWETLRLRGVFSEKQKEHFKDPYGNWHLEQADDSTYLLYPQHISRRYFCDFQNDTWQWNSPYTSPFALRIEVEGKGSISDLQVRTPNGTLYLPCTLKASQCLVFDYDGSAYITDLNYNKIEEVLAEEEISFLGEDASKTSSFLKEGVSKVSFVCKVLPEGKKQPEVSLRFLTRDTPETIILNNGDSR